MEIKYNLIYVVVISLEYSIKSLFFLIACRERSEKIRKLGRGLLVAPQLFTRHNFIAPLSADYKKKEGILVVYVIAEV